MTGKRGRPKNTTESRSIPVPLNDAAIAYLETLASAGTFGNNYTDVAAHFVREGIERMLDAKKLPRRALTIEYQIEGAENSSGGKGVPS